MALNLVESSFIIDNVGERASGKMLKLFCGGILNYMPTNSITTSQNKL